MIPCRHFLTELKLREVLGYVVSSVEARYACDAGKALRLAQNFKAS